jgi:hypothetical protein
MSETMPCPRCDGEGWLAQGYEWTFIISPARVCTYCGGRGELVARSSHPVMPECENTLQVFAALINSLPEDVRPIWLERWESARRVEVARREHDRQWDDSLWTAHRSGQ